MKAYIKAWKDETITKYTILHIYLADIISQLSATNNLHDTLLKQMSFNFTQ